MLKVAVTGWVGSGKSSMLGILGKLGYPVFSADEVVQCAYHDQSTWQIIRREFQNLELGETYSSFALQKIADYIFPNPEARHKLESILHPLVEDALEVFFLRAHENQQENSQQKPCFAEIPLLFEIGWQEKFDTCVLLAEHGSSLRIERLAATRKLSKKRINQIDRTRFPQEEAIKCSDVVIYDFLTQSDAQRKNTVDQLLKKLESGLSS